MKIKDNIRFFSTSSIVIIALSFFTYFTTLSSFLSVPDIATFNEEICERNLSDMLRSFISSIDNIYVRPLTNISLFLEYRLWGLNPIGYRIVNITMHSINSILVLFLSFFLLRNRRVALGAGVLFAIHPIHSGISFMYQSYDLICTLFYLFSLTGFALCVYLKRYRIFYLLSIIAYSLALLSKEMAITLPVVIILYDFFLVKSLSIKSFFSRLKYYSPYIVITFLYLFYRILLTGNVCGDINPATGRSVFFDFNPHNFIKNIVLYILAEFLIPTNYSIFSSSFIRLIATVFALGVIVSLVVSWKEILKNSYPILLGLLWVIITLIPVHNIVYIDIDPLVVKYIYLPSVGFCIALAFLILEEKAKGIVKNLSLTIFVTFCAIYISITNKNNSVCVQAGQFNKSIIRIVNEYYKKYGAGTGIRYYFLAHSYMFPGGVPLIYDDLTFVLATFFKPISYESVMLSAENRETDGWHYTGDFDLRQPDILNGLGQKTFFFSYNKDKVVFEDLSLQIKSNLLNRLESFKNLNIKMSSLYFSGPIESVYTTQPLHIPAYLMGGIEVRMRFKKYKDIPRHDEATIRWYKDDNTQPQCRTFSVKRDGQFHTYQIAFNIYKLELTEDIYITKIELISSSTSPSPEVDYIKILPYQ